MEEVEAYENKEGQKEGGEERQSRGIMRKDIGS